MVGDPAGGDTFEDCLNKMLCKNAFIRKKIPAAEGKFGGWTWHNGIALLEACQKAPAEAPPAVLTNWDIKPGCMAMYKSPFKKEFAKSFTAPASPGRIYRKQYEQLEKALRVTPIQGEDAVDSRISHDGVHHFLIPAFFHTLAQLSQLRRNFRVVIRTFGTDGKKVAEAINAWAEGRHPLYPGQYFPTFKVNVTQDLWLGEYKTDGSFGMEQGERTSADVKGKPTSGAQKLNETECVSLLNTGKSKVLVLSDDYFWWKNHGYVPSSGKPLWLDWNDSKCHHIFFDDNIHNDPNDSIVSVRLRREKSSGFQALTGESIRLLQERVLVRVPTVEPVLKQDWFLRKIEICERNMVNLRASKAEQLRCLQTSK